MRHLTPWIAALGLLLTGQSECPTEDTTVIMPLGDSITDGFNSPGGYRVDLYPQLADAGVSVDFVGSMSNGPLSLPDKDHEGHNGWRIDELQANVSTWIPTYQPERVILLIGTNDIIQTLDLENAPARHDLLVESIQGFAPEAHIVVASIPPLTNTTWGDLRDEVVAYNAQIERNTAQRIQAGEAISWVDVYSVVGEDDLFDGIHPNKGGYAKMADLFTQAILDAE